MGILLAGSLLPCGAQHQGGLTEREEATEKHLKATLGYALDTLGEKHSLSDAVQALKKTASTNEQLFIQLKELSICDNDGTRNLALWCLEVAFPDNDVVWKRILRDGKVASESYLRTTALQLAFIAQMGMTSANAGTDMHGPDFDDRKPAMKVSEFVKLYGKPDRKRTILGTDGRSHKWMFYGPLGIKLNFAETDVLEDQISMSTIMWSGACRAFGQDLSWQGKNAVPDMGSVFLKIKSGKK